MSTLIKLNFEGVIKFSRSAESNMVKSVLEISNTTTTNLAYKIKTTAPKKFMVKPISGILGAQRTIPVEIQIAPDAADEGASLLKNRFMIIASQTELQSSENFKLTQFWEEKEKSGDKSQMQQIVLKIAIEGNAPDFDRRETVAANVDKNIKREQSTAQVPQAKPSLYEKAPGDEINRSQPSQSAQGDAGTLSKLEQEV